MTSSAIQGRTAMRGSPTGRRPGILSGSARGADDFMLAERHSRRVRALKVALPVLGVLIAAGFAGFSYVATPPKVSVDVTGSAVSDGKLVMANPKLDGFTKENLPYSMSAARAIQEMTSTGVITLEQIDAKLPVDAENFAMITAPEGVYNRDNNTLEIPDEMTVSTTDGTKVLLRSAFIDMAAGTLQTEQPVDIAFDGARISAGSLAVSEGGKVLIFEERVRVEIDSHRVQTAQTQAERTNAKN